MSSVYFVTSPSPTAIYTFPYTTLFRSALLHPHGLRADADGALDDLWNCLRAAKDVHNFHFFRDCFQAGVTLFTQHFALVRIDGDNAVADGLQILRDTVAWPAAI